MIIMYMYMYQLVVCYVHVAGGLQHVRDNVCICTSWCLLHVHVYVAGGLLHVHMYVALHVLAGGLLHVHVHACIYQKVID